LNDPSVDHEYLPITGLHEFTGAAAKLILGLGSVAISENRTVSVQTISGTGANHLAALFLSRFYEFNGPKRIYLSDPTWGAFVIPYPETDADSAQPTISLL
jgi:aspartate aminotransferase